ncbi:MAG TPA: TIGR03013 family PEP-CTERM/XrtA system glycosyltransferase [Blastocatellia bacterium]|nr:TIGR03013 family PEP-CTERM/XrtA system glycosyltransferase [Blastocatellia bacterium]HMX26371.1 TIGR03013 family PEP-CTERM/XrtA system glycosyltransferase [Blastocatellia bacterium]HMZ17737.1 TIGR03013 family PEP-CTERM/XrtA system glycosyltransferase [Blastocatellia bacterium]HNG34791.1 TIGR03013 family PEP-CTERM/XrtA system glycosyltransferase [Blastocatellia bacterium]
MIRRGIWIKTLTLILVEAGIIFSVVILGLSLRFPKHFNSILFEQRGIYKIALTTVVSQFIFYLFDLYDVSKPRLRREVLTDLFQAVGVVIGALGLIFMLRPTLLLGYLEEAGDGGVVRYGNGVPVMAMMLALALMILWRLAIHWIMRHPRLGERILIVGSDTLAKEVAREAMLRRDLGYKVVGYVAEDPSLIGEVPINSLFSPKVLGVTGDLNRIVVEEKIDRVVVALQDRRGHMPVDQLLQIRLQGSAAIEEGTALYEKLTGKLSVEMLRPSWIIFSGGGKRSTVWGIARQLFNVTMAGLGVILSFPIGLLAAIAVKLDSPGPIFYTQERVGKNGRIFRIIKFRSMRQDAEKDGAPQWAAARDPRITRVGNFLRKTRIDEIPQFINILRGEMSFVGPRAERPVFVEQLTEQIPFYSQRHLVEPGLTGWAQVNYGYGASVEDAIQKLQYDLYYIKNVSLLFDIWIMFKTIKIVLFGYGR